MERGTYILVLELEGEVEIAIGRRGSFVFPAGCYVYAGSALNGLSGRIARHLRRKKKLRWHIDYLTVLARPVAVHVYRGRERRECEAASYYAGRQGARIPVPRFGASDCRCGAHLAWLPEVPEGNALPSGFARWPIGDAGTHSDESQP